MKSFKEELASFELDLNSFITRNELPGDWFKSPDHLAIKCADSKDYDQQIQAWKKHSETGKMSEVKLHGRRLAVARLLKEIPLTAFGGVYWLEIMEPRPEKIGKGIVGLEHIEFYSTNFDVIQKVLSNKGIEYEMQGQDNPGHSWVNIILNDAGQELKLNDNPLSVVIPQELQDGSAYWV
jgi:predicted metalloenzyme YecM